MIPFSHYQESAEYLQRVTSGFAPRVALVLGSGLGVLGDRVEDPIFVDYKDIPHFPVAASTAMRAARRRSWSIPCGF